MDIDGVGSLTPLPPPENGPEDAPMAVTPERAAPEPLSFSPGQFPATPSEQRQMIMEKDQASQGLKAGRSYYLLDRRWHIEWLQWVGHHSVTSPKHGPVDVQPSLPGRERSASWSKERPGPIDNAHLFDTGDSSKLKRDIHEHEHYDIVSEEVWQLLHSWYGGGPPAKRRAIEQPNGSVVVELHGISLNVYKSSDSATSVAMIESKTTSVESLKNRACEELGLEVDKVRIWDYFNKRKYANLEESLSKSLDECRIFDNNDLLLEEQNADGTWPPDETRATPNAHWSSSSYTSAAEDVPTTGTPLVKGAVGLQNLGNTCFMNSSIQCLSSVPELRDYFTSETYKDHLNSGAFKTKGKLAEAFSQLLKHIWNPTTTQVAPRNFKWQIGQFADQFAGYGQQDSMEFIEYALQGLMEDVNQVQGPKPFVELKEADGRPDPEVAEEAQENYKRRNNSMIDNLFTGFFKSTVRCPEQELCRRESVKFDPFCSIKLALNSAIEERSQRFDVSVVFLTSPRDPVRRITVSVLKSGNAGDLIEAAAKEVGLEAKSCFLGEIYQKKFYKLFNNHDAVEQIGVSDILVLYELPKEQGPDKCDLVIHARQDPENSSWRSPQLLGLPLVASVDRQISGKDLIEAVRSAYLDRLDINLDDADFEGKWRLNRTTEKSLAGYGSDKVTPEDEQFDLGSRHYVICDFDKEVQLPQALTNMFQEPGYGRPTRPLNPVTLDRCFQMLKEEEKLSSQDTWYCNRCKDHVEAYKKLEIWSLPPVLVVQLKRFTYTAYTRDRLDLPVVFPLKGLDLRDMVLGPDSERCIYDLIAVSRHMGGLGGGHYVAYSRSAENGQWYDYNDSQVRAVSPEEVENDQTAAYVLFYIRQDNRPKSWVD